MGIINGDTRSLDYDRRVQVTTNHIPAQHVYYNYYYPKPAYLIIGCLDPLVIREFSKVWGSFCRLCALKTTV